MPSPVTKLRLKPTSKTPSLDGGPSLLDPFRPEAASLKARMEPPGRGIPHVLVGSHEGIDFELRQLNPLITQRGQCFCGPFDKAPAQFFVGDDLPDQQLNCSLRHTSAFPLTRNRNAHSTRTVAGLG